MQRIRDLHGLSDQAIVLDNERAGVHAVQQTEINDGIVSWLSLRGGTLGEESRGRENGGELATKWNAFHKKSPFGWIDPELLPIRSPPIRNPGAGGYSLRGKRLKMALANRAKCQVVPSAEWNWIPRVPRDSAPSV